MSSISQHSKKLKVSKFLIQSLFLFALASVSIVCIVMEWGNTSMWTMFLALSVAHMLNLPVLELATLLSEGFKSNQPMNSNS